MTRASFAQALVDHLVTTYHDPLREELPRLEAMAARVSRVHGDKAEHLTRPVRPANCGGANVVYSTFLRRRSDPPHARSQTGRRRSRRRARGDAVLRRHLMRLEPETREVIMDPVEGQAKAIIAAALIVRGAVEVPAMPSGSEHMPDAAGMRLRELTDYLYRLLTTEAPPEAK